MCILLCKFSFIFTNYLYLWDLKKQDICDKRINLWSPPPLSNLCRGTEWISKVTSLPQTDIMDMSLLSVCHSNDLNIYMYHTPHQYLHPEAWNHMRTTLNKALLHHYIWWFCYLKCSFSARRQCRCWPTCLFALQTAKWDISMMAQIHGLKCITSETFAGINQRVHAHTQGKDTVNHRQCSQVA